MGVLSRDYIGIILRNSYIGFRVLGSRVLSLGWALPPLSNSWIISII